MPSPTVSVVIPTYNRRAETIAAVDSAVAQDPAPLEVLVCDDGSTDDTRAVFERRERDDERVRYVRLPRNAGRPAPARNRGIRAARGEWVAFLDSDDRWLPGKLARHAGHLSAGAHDVLATDAFRSGGGRYFEPAGAPRELDRAEVLRHNPIILSTAIVRRSLLQRVGGFEEARWATGVEDYALWLDVSAAGARFVVFEEPLAVYDDAGDERLSAAAVARQRGVARLLWSRSLRRPRDGALAAAAVRETVNFGLVALDARRRGVR